MKIIKINSIKLIAITLAFGNLMLISCDNVKKQNTRAEVITVETSNDIAEKNIKTVEVDGRKADMNKRERKEEITTRTYKMKERAIPLVYNLDMNGIAGFDDWADYTVVNYELAEIRKANYITTQQRVRNMNYRIANLGNTIPAWLKTEEVMEDVADIQKEYLELISEQDASEKEMKENLEELSEKFDDLKEELDETVNEYVKIHEEAIEEFNEEMKKGKIDAAIEEYNEEIKKMDKIVKKK